MFKYDCRQFLNNSWSIKTFLCLFMRLLESWLLVDVLISIIFQKFVANNMGVRNPRLVSEVWDLISVEINKVSVVRTERVQEQLWTFLKLKYGAKNLHLVVI